MISIYENLKLPLSCYVGNTIFKKLFYENADFSKADRDLFTDVVEKITWVYCLKPDTINIQFYKDEMRDYPEIEVIEAMLTGDKKTERIAEIIMRTIPYPMLLVLKLEDNIRLFTAHQRTSQNDSSKNTLEELISTDWLTEGSPIFNKLDVTQMRLANYYTLYSDIVDVVSIFNAEKLTGMQKELTGEQARALTAQIENLESQIENLRAQMKKETQFNKKVELNMEIKKLETQKMDYLKGSMSDV